MNNHTSAQELDVVELTEDLPEHGLSKGSRGTVVETFNDPEEAYMVEFQDHSNGTSKIVDCVLPNQIENLDKKAVQLFNSGLAQLAENHQRDAVRLFRIAVALKPALVRQLHQLFVEQFENLKSWESFGFGMRLLMDVDPTFDLAKDNLAIALLNQGVENAKNSQFKSALLLFQRAFLMPTSEAITDLIKQNMTSTHVALGVVAHRNSDFDRALTHMQEAYKLTPNELTRRNLGLAYLAVADKALEGDDFEKAAANYSLAEEAGMRTTEGLNNRAIAHLHLENVGAAIQSLETAVLLDENNTTARANLKLIVENVDALRNELLEQVRQERTSLIFSNLPPGAPVDLALLAAA